MHSIPSPTAVGAWVVNGYSGPGHRCESRLEFSETLDQENSCRLTSSFVNGRGDYGQW